MIDRASARVAAGLFFVIIFMLVGLGLLARMQMPVEVATAGDTVTTDANAGAESAAPDADADAEVAADAQEAEQAEDGDVQEAEQAEDGDAQASTEVTETETTETTDASATDGQAASEDAGETQAETTAAETGSDDSSPSAGASLTTDELVMAFAAGGCSSCHVIPKITGAVGVLGPDLSTIGTVAASRVEGQSAEAYIRESLHEPNAYVVAECPTGPCIENVMQAANITALSEDEVEGIVNYMLALTTDAEAPAIASADENATEPAEAEPETADTADADTQADPEPAPVDMEAVAAVVTKGTCGACHVIPGVDAAAGVLGPDLSNIGATAATRIESYTAEAYLLESIMDPNAFIAPECPTGDCLPNIMLPNLAELLTEEEIGTIINYLVTLDDQG